MSNTWSKEDIAHYNDSEVFAELEKKVLETILRTDILSKKAAASEEDVATQKAMNTELQKTKDLVSNLSDDAEGFEEEYFEEEDDNPDLTEAVINELRALAEAAISERNTKLAYKIERTIDEILEQEVKCG